VYENRAHFFLSDQYRGIEELHNYIAILLTLNAYISDVLGRSLFCLLESFVITARGNFNR
jgi:hypothetical protein